MLAFFLAAIFAFFLLYAIARLTVSGMPVILATLSASTLLIHYFEGGNLAEEYAMPFIALSLYFFLSYLLHKRTSPARILLSGMAFACVCLLRPNMTAVWIVSVLPFSGPSSVTKTGSSAGSSSVAFCSALPRLSFRFLSGFMQEAALPSASMTTSSSTHATAQM